MEIESEGQHGNEGEHEETEIKNGPYLDNFVTNPMYILAYSDDSDPE